MLLVATTSCWQDRSGEYYALVGSKNWIYTTMQEYYLYYQDLPEESELDFFQKPAEFLSSVVSEKDGKNGVTYSHIDSIKTADTRSLSESPTFGFEAVMLQTQQGSYAMQVLYTQPQSPAEEAGLKRGLSEPTIRKSVQATTPNMSPTQRLHILSYWEIIIPKQAR